MMRTTVLVAVLALLAFSLSVLADGDDGQVQKQERERNNWCVRSQVRLEGEAAGEPDVCVKLKLRNHERKGARLKVKAKGLEKDAECEFRILDPVSGEVLATKEVQTTKRGRLRIKARSREGDPLFCGEDNAEGMCQARFEICYRNGESAVSGEMPSP